MNDNEYNPGQNDIDSKTDFLKRAENNRELAKKSELDNLDDIKSAEQNPESNWKNNVTNNTDKTKSKVGFKSFVKKKGPLTAILITLIGGGLGIGGLLSPSLLIVNLKEVMVGKFNTQLTAMDIRSNKILKSKVLGFSNCGALIKCKYSTMSDYQIKRLKKAGIEVKYEGTNIVNRKKITELTFDNKTISAKNFGNEMATNTKFRSSIKKAYNPLFAGFADSFWNKALFKLRITENGIELKGLSDEEKLKDIQERTKSGEVELKKPVAPNDADYKNDPDGLEKANKQYAEELAEFDNNAKGLMSAIDDGAAEVAQSGVKATTKITANAVKITGAADTACMVYSSVRAVGFAAKTVRAAQLARYAMLFLVVADQIKAGGNPAPEDVSYLGSVLTEEAVLKDYEGKPVTDTNGNIITQTATDSAGYKNAAYNEVNKLPDSATQFLAGAGLAGTFIGVTSSFNTILGGSPKKVCRTLNNVFVQIGSAVAGIGLAFLSGGLTLTAGMFAQIGLSVSVVALLAYLPALLKDIVAGVVIDSDTVGGLAGNAITSGSGTIMSTAASEGGNAPLTVDQAVAYNELSKQVAAEYAQEDRLAYSPFDTSNKNTFLGSIVSKITPYFANMTSIPNTLSSISSLTLNSFSFISPITKATSANEYQTCEDEDYKELGLATDIFCNVIYGVPTNSLNSIDPLEVIDTLISEKQIDETGKIVDGSDFEDFTKTCTNRSDPLGFENPNASKPDDGINCIIGSSKYNLIDYYYLYQIDQRVESGMDGQDRTLEAAYEAGLDSDISFYNGLVSDSNVAKSNTSFFDSIINMINFKKATNL